MTTLVFHSWRVRASAREHLLCIRMQSQVGLSPCVSVLEGRWGEQSRCLSVLGSCAKKEEGEGHEIKASRNSLVLGCSRVRYLRPRRRRPEEVSPRWSTYTWRPYSSLAAKDASGPWGSSARQRAAFPLRPVPTTVAFSDGRRREPMCVRANNG